ncbi:putative pentatricopeptide repeat-containing protein At3g15200 [Neltuma alba]|uniref:putative pentatricopeptide repeat-containing protein At3g15200 n=1 Tax=Neltuma alba TaxID=207710 RepID=UPI0010A34043|nr:putative pentatricopeptide repeat-containing protein At3g15200 [Prosopis alba]
MPCKIRPLLTIALLKSSFNLRLTDCHCHHTVPKSLLSHLHKFSYLRLLQNPSSGTLIRARHPQLLRFLGIIGTTRFVHSVADFRDAYDESAVFVQKLLKFRRDKPTEEIERALDLSRFELNHDSVLKVLRRHRSDWRPAVVFFRWASKAGARSRYTPSSDVYNEIIDLLGRAKRFEELNQVFDEMSRRKGLVNEVTFRILLSRHAAAHKVEEAIDIFYRRKEFGMELDLPAFQTLLISLCRYKHVEDAETLFRNKINEFPPDIKTWNVILNGWCVLGNVYEAKRFWKDIMASRCKPDLFTYGTFIKALTQKGKLGTALKLFRGMWDKGMVEPDVVICNCIIDALCFKKRIPEALEVFQDMNKRGCLTNVATYNCLIKYMCKIGRQEKVDELVNEMLQRKGSCMPNAVTYSYLLTSVKGPEEIPMLLEMMERNGCTMNDDIYNLVLRLYMGWDSEVGVRKTWEGMEKHGWGPDRRSYTIMIHGHYGKGRTKEALRYFREMTLKGMVPEPRTEKLLNTMNLDEAQNKKT